MKTLKDTNPLILLSGNPFLRFFQGLGLPIRGAGYLLKRPKLWLFIMIPFFINIILFLVFLIWGYSWFGEFLKSRLGEGENLAWYWKGLAIIARIFFWLLALILVYFTFTPLALIIASPFNDYLAETVEKECGCEVEDQRPLFRKIAGEALFAIKSEIKRLVLFLMVFLILFPLNIIPVIGSVAYLVLNFIWACYGLAFEFTGYATDRRHIPLKIKLNLLNGNLAFFLGFGFITTLFMMIPFMNVFAVSLSAVSGTLAFFSVQNTNTSA